MNERKHMKNREPSRGQPPEMHIESSTAMHDAEIRKHLGALVQEMIAKGQFDQLRQILTDHVSFMQDILEMMAKKDK